MTVMLSRAKIVISLSLAFSTSPLVGGSGSESSLLVTPVVVQGDLLPGRHLQTTFRLVNLVDRQITLRIEGLNDDGVVEGIFCPGPVVGGPERILMLPANGKVEKARLKEMTIFDLDNITVMILAGFSAR